MALETRTIEIITDNDNYDGKALVEVDSWEEFKELAKEGETLAMYQGDEWIGAFYSFDPYDEKNPSQYGLKDWVYDWISNKIQEGENTGDSHYADMLEDEYEDNLSMMAEDYIGRWWDLNAEEYKLFMSVTEDGGPFGGRDGIVHSSWGDDFTVYRVIDMDDYMESLEE